jgi:hypothetical protein
MIPHVPETAGLVDTSAARQQASFPYQQLLAFHRGELADPQVYAAVDERVRKDRRWQAHWDSIRYLDLDRAAAFQDAAELGRFTAAQATPFCNSVAESCGDVFVPLFYGANGAGDWDRKAWSQHVDRCAYCRRMRRHTHARLQRRDAGLPAGEPLLRDWLLMPRYVEALREATRRLGFEWMLQDPGPDQSPPASGDTILNSDTVLHENPPPRN